MLAGQVLVVGVGLDTIINLGTETRELGVGRGKVA
jgi:hypothetical protein